MKFYLLTKYENNNSTSIECECYRFVSRMDIYLFFIDLSYVIIFLVDGEVISSIGTGLCILIGICREDTEKDINYMWVRMIHRMLFYVNV